MPIDPPMDTSMAMQSRLPILMTGLDLVEGHGIDVADRL